MHARCKIQTCIILDKSHLDDFHYLSSSDFKWTLTSTKYNLDHTFIFSTSWQVWDSSKFFFFRFHVFILSIEYWPWKLTWYKIKQLLVSIQPFPDVRRCTQNVTLNCIDSSCLWQGASPYPPTFFYGLYWKVFCQPSMVHNQLQRWTNHFGT